MSTEGLITFNQSVKKVEFFPFEWSQNLLAVCLSDQIKIYSFNCVKTPKTESEGGTEEMMSQDGEESLQLLLSIDFNNRIDHFTWSPLTNISTLRPIVQFAVCDNSGNLKFFTTDITKDSIRCNEVDFSSNLKFNEIKIEGDIVYKLAYDNQNGETLAFTMDHSCFLWNCVESKYKAKFSLQSAGVDICWHRDEKNKLMIAERCGLIRIYNLETLRPIYSLMCMNVEKKIANLCILSIDWCQTNPETVIANTNSEILIWNTSKSCLPDKIIENVENLRSCKIAKFKEDLIGYLTGTDSLAKLNILNFKSNQMAYQSKNMKLLNTFSFNSTMPLFAIGNEQKLTIMSLVN